MQIYWSSDFKVKAYVPQFKDDEGTLSPQSLNNGGDLQLKTVLKGKTLVLSGCQGLELTIYKDETGVTAEDGTFVVPTDNFEFPLEDITYVEISNGTGSTVVVNFVYYYLPENVEG